MGLLQRTIRTTPDKTEAAKERKGKTSAERFGFYSPNEKVFA